MGDKTRGDPRIRAHYARLFENIEATHLPEALELHELADEAILTVATQLIPDADAKFCRDVRKIAAFLHRALETPPPPEKEVKKKLEQVREVVIRLKEKLESLPFNTRRSVGELVSIVPTPVCPSESTVRVFSPMGQGGGGAFQPNPELDRSENHEGQAGAPMPQWELDDPVGQILCELKVFQKRVDARLAERGAGGRPRSPKWFVLLLLCRLVHERKGSCSESELSTEAYLQPLLALHQDFADLSDHIQSVVDEVSRLPENGTPN